MVARMGAGGHWQDGSGGRGTVGRVAVVAAIVLGVAAGLGAYTFVYAKGASYLTQDPAACANCHAMNDHFAAWEKGSHRHVAVCNDCHTPHNLVGKYAVKANNGFWHSFAFTSGRYPDPIRIKAYNRRVIESACRRCHGSIVEAIDTGHRDDTACLHCHATVGHNLKD